MGKEVAHISGGNKALYIIMAAILIILIGYAVWGLISKGAISGSNLEVSNLTISKDSLVANGKDFSTVEINIANKEGIPASNMWVGLKITDITKATESFSYFGWYSPEPNKSFYQTDENGKVSYAIKSEIAGDINYEIFVTGNSQSDGNGYQSLDKKFILHFQPSAQ
ncbi:hypothetical protein KKE14_03360 [Patescibacteria group bacterium]|nr:hypothetical protein [Patescibacteria group bacterium]